MNLWLSVRLFVPPALLRLPLNPPLLSPLPTNGSGDQGDQLGAGRGRGAGRGSMNRLCTLHGRPSLSEPRPRRNIPLPPRGGAARSCSGLSLWLGGGRCSGSDCVIVKSAAPAVPLPRVPGLWGCSIAITRGRRRAARLPCA